MLPWQRPSGDPWPQLEAVRGEAYLEIDVAFIFFCLHPDFDTYTSLGSLWEPLVLQPQSPTHLPNSYPDGCMLLVFSSRLVGSKEGQSALVISAQLRRNCLVLKLLLSITSTNHNCTAGKRALAAS